ncbi:MAG: TIGR03016 family PEP-CTERM system-associated outer membrane protein [Zoogloea sp.]|nr:TIGR03016 family PEP-CTERM system-associated outer membrane protein [Zoogloea sp.]
MDVRRPRKAGLPRLRMKPGQAPNAKLLKATRIALGVLAVIFDAGNADAENWYVLPRLTIMETLTDNVDLGPDDGKESALVTDIVPSIHIDGESARSKLRLDYEMHSLTYSQDSGRNNTQHYLNTAGSLEAIEKWMYLEARGNISQQAISSFGAQPFGNASVNENRTETSYYEVSPYIAGRVGSLADYLLRYRAATSQSTASTVGNAKLSEVTGNIKDDVDTGKLGWTVDGNSVRNDYDEARSVEAARVKAALVYMVDQQFRATVSGGRERNNYSSQDQESKNNYGAGFDWAPSERTKVSAMKERRFFGNGHNISVRHRTARTAWSYTDTRDVSTLLNELAATGTGNTFDLLYSALANSIPDPLARAREVQRLLQENGIPADLRAASSFLTTRVFVERNRELSLALLGLRNTITMAATLTERRALGIGATITDDFNSSPDIRQQGVSVDWAHRLTPRSSLNVLASRLHTTGTPESGFDSRQRLVRVNWSTQLGPRTYATVGARQVQFKSTTAQDFRERAIVAALSVSF